MINNINDIELTEKRNELIIKDLLNYLLIDDNWKQVDLEVYSCNNTFRLKVNSVFTDGYLTRVDREIKLKQLGL